MRIFYDTGFYVECFLQDQCPRLYNVTQEKGKSLPTEKTVVKDVPPSLSATKQSFYQKKAWLSMVLSKRSKRKSARPLTASVSAIDDDSGTDLPVLTEDSSADELGPARPSVESEDSGSDESVIQTKARLQAIWRQRSF